VLFVNFYGQISCICHVANCWWILCWCEETVPAGVVGNTTRKSTVASAENFTSRVIMCYRLNWMLSGLQWVGCSHIILIRTASLLQPHLRPHSRVALNSVCSSFRVNIICLPAGYARTACINILTRYWGLGSGQWVVVFVSWCTVPPYVEWG